jgi:RimJ/RimL family protein N-acetyltransferase
MNFWQGEHIRLRAIEPDDSEFFFTALQDASIQKYESDIRIPMSLKACNDLVLSEASKGNDNDSPFLIIEDVQKNKVGMISPSYEDKRVGVFTCGIFIKPEYQRKGYAREALSLVLKFYFDQLRCQKFNVSVYEYNNASNRLCEKMGLIMEGRRRKTAYADGKYYDEILYGLTIEEYRNRT